MKGFPDEIPSAWSTIDTYLEGLPDSPQVSRNYGRGIPQQERTLTLSQPLQSNHVV